LRSIEGNRLHPAILGDILEIYRGNDFKRIITHIEKDNVAAFKGADKVGFTPFEEVPELRILFLTRRKFRRVDG